MNVSDLQKVAAKLPLSKSVLARNTQYDMKHVTNLGQFGTVETPEARQPERDAPLPLPPLRGARIRQSKKPLLNKLETEFWNEYLLARYPKARAQSIRLRLANGVTFTPDFIDMSVQPVKAWEVKGPHAWEDSIIKLKLAAAQYPEIKWIMVWREAGGAWAKQEVLP